MKSNIIKAAINLGCIPGTKILEFYKEIGRDCADVNEAAFDYIQDVFAGTVREEDAATRAKKLKMTFDPDAEDYPTMAVGGGDGDVIILNRIALTMLHSFPLRIAIGFGSPHHYYPCLSV